MCWHADNVIERWLLWQERHFPWGFNLWYIVLEIVSATFTQLEMLQLSHSKILESSPVSRASNSGWYSGKLKSQWALASLPHTCHQAGTDPQLGRVTRGRIWKSRATYNAKFLSATRITACLQPTKPGPSTWVGYSGLTFIAVPVLFCVFNVFKSMSRLMEWGRKSWRED